MNPMTAFIGLLFLAYVGSILVGQRAVRGYGLPSGSEYLLFGFLLGPAVLGLITPRILDPLSPLLDVGAGWLLLLSGLEWGTVDGRATRARFIAASSLLALVTGGLLFGASYWVLGRLPGHDQRRRFLLAGAVAAIGMETTRVAVRWVIERYGAKGPLSRAVSTLTDADELPALLLVGALFVLSDMPEVRIQVPPVGWFGITLGLGAGMGLISVALMGGALHHGEAKGLIFGAVLLCTGLATELGLAGVVSSFVLGVTLSRVSPHRAELLDLLRKSEQAVLLPVLLLAGALVSFSDRRLPFVLGAALAARFTGKVLTGLVLYATKSGRAAGPLLGLGLLPSGVVTIALALSLSRRWHSPDGDLVLAVAVGMTLFGELLGPLSLKRSLLRAGELENPSGRRSDPPLAETSPRAEPVSRPSGSEA